MVRRPTVDARRFAALVVVVAITFGLAAKSAFGSFAGASNVTHSINSGTMGMSLASGDAAQPLDGVGITVYPGVANERLVNLTITGTVDHSVMATSAGLCVPGCVGSELNTDTVNGVQWKIERCSQPWTHSGGVAPERTYTCGGTTELVQPAFPVVNFKLLTVDPADSLMTVGSVNYYRFTFSISTSAPSSMQGDLSGITFHFNGNQRNATNK